LARRVFPQSGGNFYNCVKAADSPYGTRGNPNAVCRGNRADSEPTEYRLNGCGHRAGMECGPKLPGTYRVVMLGSSFTIGEGVSIEKTSAALLPRELTEQTGRKVEVYNEGMFGEIPFQIAAHFDEVLAVKPDLILWELTPRDIMAETIILSAGDHPTADEKGSIVAGAKPSYLTRVRRRVHFFFSTRPFFEAAGDLWEYCIDVVFPHPTSLVLLRHVLYLNQSEYLRTYLMGDAEAEFLKDKPKRGWLLNMQKFTLDDAKIEAQSKAAGVPMVTVLLPTAAQAAMVSVGSWPAGYDPYKLDHQLHSIVTSHGGTYISILPSFRDIPNPERDYFQVNAHPNAQGHAILSILLAKELTHGSAPALTSHQPPYGQRR
jgi:hypothetical protein